MNKLTTYIKNLDLLDFAFQPIVDIETKKVFAVEALLRNTEILGYKDIHHFFDAMYEKGLLYKVDILLRDKALGKFTKLPDHQELKLFYNLDNRLLEMADYRTGTTDNLIKKHGLHRNNLCFEISERHEIKHEMKRMKQTLQHYQDEGFCLAIDDFGTGFAGFKLLYEFTPDVIKIDRFFLSGICNNPKKKIIVTTIIQLAKELGAKIIAEGIELESELMVCREMGCEFIQGYLIQKPSSDINDIKGSYSAVQKVA